MYKSKSFINPNQDLPSSSGIGVKVEIIIQPDGNVLLPRGFSVDNHFLIELFHDLVDENTRQSLIDFFRTAEESEIIFGSPGFCG